METHQNRLVMNSVPTKVSLNKRLEESAWGFFLLMIGILILLPSHSVPTGTWLVGAGVILLALNIFRYLNDIDVSRMTVVLGLVVILVGVISFFGMNASLMALVLAVVGLSVIVKSIFPGSAT